MESPGVLWTVMFFVMALAPLIFIHELGHYLVGRWCGVHAEVFSIGFGRSIAGWTDRRGTYWKIGWMPLGGYVRFLDDAPKGDGAGAAKPAANSFSAQPVGKRALIVGAGPAINFLLAFLIIAGVIGVLGEPRTPPVIAGVMPHSAAAAAGLKPGDRVLSVNGDKVERFEDLEEVVRLRPGVPMPLAFERAGRVETVTITPREDVIQDRFGNEMRRGLLGVMATSREMKPVPWLDVPARAVDYTVRTTQMMAHTLWQVISGARSVKELGGPIKIAQISGQQASLGMMSFLFLMAMLSINLGFINLLPIPMLDGGHLLFYGVEAVQGRPVPLSVQDYAFRAGFALLVAFMLMVTVNDLAGIGLWRHLSGLIG